MLARATFRRSLIALSLVLATTAGVSACSSSSQAGVTGPSNAPIIATGTHVDAAAFSRAMVEPNTVLIDVRTPSEFAAGHIMNATNIDVESADFAAQIESLDKSKTYALYCHSGRRSGIALDEMKQAGFTHVYDLNGGIQAWTAAGGELVTS